MILIHDLFKGIIFLNMKKLLSLILIASSPMAAAVNDIFPTDYVANKPGDVVTTLYLSESESDTYYRNKSKILDETLSTSVQALRLGYSTQLFGFTTAFTAVGFHAKNTFEGPTLETLYPKTTSGYGDLRLGVTAWLLNDRENMHYFAITPMISLPVGTYDAARSINIGENRYKATLSAGYVNRFLHGDGGELFLELSPEFAFYGDNDNAQGRKIEQEPSFALTGYLRYRPIPIAGLFVGYQINRGGETSIDEIAQNDEAKNTKIMFGGAVFVLGTQITLRHAEDIDIENGFKTDRQTTLRLQWIF
jgi:hypothetical protein